MSRGFGESRHPCRLHYPAKQKRHAGNSGVALA